jgi:hypothetical protein
MSDTNNSDDYSSFDGLSPPYVDKITTHDSPTALKITKLDKSNWSSWHDQMRHAICHYKLQSYLDGTLVRPNKGSISAENWDNNNNYAQMLIMFNIDTKQNIHISQCKTSNAMWANLAAVHESKGNQTAMAIMQNIWAHSANNTTDIPEHITNIKQHWDRLNLCDDKDFATQRDSSKSSLPLHFHPPGMPSLTSTSVAEGATLYTTQRSATAFSNS